MTVQEAVQGLKNLFSQYELTLPNTDSLDVLMIALEAMEKQIPKKVLVCEEFMSLIRCPECNGIVGDKQEYCDECGQRLDWG